MTPDSQTSRILEHLQTGSAITPLAALRLYGSLRLGARIWDLRREGHPIEKRMVTVGSGRRTKRFAEYRLAG